MKRNKVIHLELEISPPYNTLGVFTLMGQSPAKDEKGTYFTSRALELKDNYKISINDRGTFQYKPIKKPKVPKEIKKEEEE